MELFIILCLVWTIVILISYIRKLKDHYFNLKEENKALRFKLGIKI